MESNKVVTNIFSFFLFRDPQKPTSTVQLQFFKLVKFHPPNHKNCMENSHEALKWPKHLFLSLLFHNINQDIAFGQMVILLLNLFVGAKCACVLC